MVEDVFTDTLDSEDNWIEVSPEFINSLNQDNLNVDTFFEEVDFEAAEKAEVEIKEKRSALEKEKQEIKKKAKKAKTDE